MVETNSTKAAKNGKREFICERQGKNLYHSDKPDLIIQEFRSNGVDESKKRGKVRDCDILRNEISTYLFEYIEGFHIPTYFVGKLSDTEMMVKKSEIIPLSVKVYNTGNGVLSQRFGIAESEELEFPIIEHYARQSDNTDAWVNEYHIYAFNIASPEEYKQINRISSKVNAVLRGLCDRRQLTLTGMQLEFGRYKDQVLLCDELSPYTCYFIDPATNDKRRQDRFTPSHENAVESFAELFDRLTLKV